MNDGQAVGFGKEALGTPATLTPPGPSSLSPVAFIVRCVRRRVGAFVALLALVTTAASCAVAVQYGMKLIVDAMTSGDRHAALIWRWLALFLGLIAAESACWRAAGWLGCKSILGLGEDVRLDLFRHLTGHSMGFFSAHMAGSLGGRITGTAGAMGIVLSALTWKIIPPVVDFLGAIVVFSTLDWRMALALCGFVGLLGTAVLRFGLEGRHLHQRFAQQASQVNGELVDVVANIWAVKAFSGAAREWRRLQAAVGAEAQAQQSSWLYLEKARGLHDLCMTIMAGIMLAWALWSWRSGHGTSGDVVLVSALTFRILHGSRDLALASVDAAQQLGVISDTLKVVFRPHAVVDQHGARTFEATAGVISIQHVDFSYPGASSVLRDFSLEIPAGQRCGIVGPSGAGKSTLLGLLQRLDDVHRGTICIDGQDIKTVQQSSLRAAIAVVPQDVSLLHRSVIDNIGYGRCNASREEVMQAARDSGCEDFIQALPHGGDTIVGERGTHLSGGQRQRIGIARAFLKQAPVLLLDEATSSLDSESERMIEAALERLMRQRTVIAVAHRLSTVARFDRVVVMDGGRIVEDGAPSVLQEAGGLYARLWRLQAEGQFAL